MIEARGVRLIIRVEVGSVCVARGIHMTHTVAVGKRTTNSISVLRLRGLYICSVQITAVETN